MTRRQQSADPLLLGPGVQVKDWKNSWAAFRSSNSVWWKRVASGNPVYLLPTAVLDALAASRARQDSQRASASFIDEASQDAERVFRAVCVGTAVDVIGVWNDVPVRYPLLSSGDGRPEAAVPELREGAIRELRKAAAADLAGRAAFVGAQVFTSQFQEELAAFHQRWEELEWRPLFPFQASWSDQPPEVGVFGRERLPILVDAWVKDLGGWLRRRRLARLITWELPEAIGNLEFIPTGLATSVCGPDVPSIVLSPPGVSNAARRPPLPMDRLQEAVAQAAGLPPSTKGQGIKTRADQHPKKEMAFRFWLIEQTLGTRYPYLRRHKARLAAALAGLLPIRVTVDRVKQIQAVYRPFLKSTRDSI